MRSIKSSNKHALILNSRKTESTPALFLDRDGVVIEDVHYIKRPDEVKICPGIDDLMKQASQLKVPVVIVTNQSGISRGYTTWEAYEKVSKHMLQLLDYPKALVAIYANSEIEYTGKINEWRKPGAGMIFKAAKEFNLSIENSAMIGDRLSDLEAGVNAGMKKIYHVLTGHGRNERAKIPSKIASKLTTHSAKIRLIDSLEGYDLSKEPNISLVKK